MSSKNVALLALLASVVAASPAKTTTTANFCSGVNKVVTAAGAQSAASAFCSSYLHIPVSTVTSTTTPVTTKTVTDTQTITPPTATQTVTTTITNTPTDTETDTSTTGTVTQTSTGNSCPTGPSNPQVSKRAVPVERAVTTKTKPSCLNTYTPGAALSSACSCLNVPKSTTTTTVAAPTSTATSHVTTTTTLAQQTTTATVTQTVDGPHTTVTVTQKVDATTTVFQLATPTCTAILEAGKQGTNDNGGDLTYNNYFAGCNVRDTPTNPGGSFYRTYPGSDDVCTAAAACALEGAQGPDELSFDLYRIASGAWQCQIFTNANSDPSQRAPDPTVGESYFYST